MIYDMDMCCGDKAALEGSTSQRRFGITSHQRSASSSTLCSFISASDAGEPWASLPVFVSTSIPGDETHLHRSELHLSATTSEISYSITLLYNIAGQASKDLMLIAPSAVVLGMSSRKGG